MLELGGKDAVVVDAGIDVQNTAEAVAHGAFLNTGQICASMERIYIHQDVAEEFTGALVAAAETYAPGEVLGPLVDERQRDIVRLHVADAVERDAKVRTGSEEPTGKGFFHPPTVLTGVDDTMLVMTEETFGPVAPRPGRDGLHRRPGTRRRRSPAACGHRVGQPVAGRQPRDGLGTGRRQRYGSHRRARRLRRRRPPARHPSSSTAAARSRRAATA
ncbi:aldehyde dehydrogenase family protein [Streptomyces sp. NPDC055239]